MDVGNESVRLSLTYQPQGLEEDVMVAEATFVYEHKGTISPIFKGCFKDPLEEKNGTI